MADLLNSIGLFLDIIGVVLLYQYGLPEEISRQGTSLLAWGNDPEEKKKAEKYDRRSRAAIVFLVVGFLM